MVTKENRKQGREARRMSSRARTRPAHASVPATRPCFLLRTVPRGNPTRASPLSWDPCPVATPPPRVRVPPLLPAPCSWESPAWGGGGLSRDLQPLPGPPARTGHGQGVGTLAPPQPLGAGLSLPLLLLAALGLPGAGSRIPVTSVSVASWPSPVSPLWLPSPSKDIGPVGLRAKPTPVGPR